MVSRNSEAAEPGTVPPVARSRRGARILLFLALALLGVYLAALAVITNRIAQQARRDEARRADVILILGAAEYAGRPSPVLRARLDHGLNLYRRGLAERIMTTGGSGGDPLFTESEVGRDYLIRRGVAPEAVIVEPEGSSTVHSVAATAEILRRMDLHSCIVVTDGYHVFRVKRMLQRAGLAVYGSPRPGDAKNTSWFWWLCARQAGAYLLWRAGVAI